LDDCCTESMPRLLANETIGLWFWLPKFVIDDIDLMEALREPLSRRIYLAGTHWGALLIEFEDVWSWLFYGRSWLNRQVQVGLEVSKSMHQR
jgi:hypothetical protein